MLEDATPTELDPKNLKYLRPRTEDLGGEEAIYRLNVDQQMALGVGTRLALVKGEEVKVTVKVQGGLNKNK